MHLWRGLLGLLVPAVRILLGQPRGIPPWTLPCCATDFSAMSLVLPLRRMHAASPLTGRRRRIRFSVSVNLLQCRERIPTNA